MAKKRIIKYGVTIAVGLLIAFAVAQGRGLFTSEDAQTAAMYVSDAFFVPAVLLLGVGAIVWISTTGFFDIFGYAVRSVAYRFIKPGKYDSNGTFYDYHAEKEEHRGKAQPFLFYCGAGFLVAAVIAYIVYTQV